MPANQHHFPPGLKSTWSPHKQWVWVTTEELWICGIYYFHTNQWVSPIFRTASSRHNFENYLNNESTDLGKMYRRVTRTWRSRLTTQKPGFWQNLHIKIWKRNGAATNSWSSIYVYTEKNKYRCKNLSTFVHMYILHISISQFWRLQSPRSMCQQIWCMAKGLLLGLQLVVPYCLFTERSAHVSLVLNLVFVCSCVSVGTHEW